MCEHDENNELSHGLRSSSSAMRRLVLIILRRGARASMEVTCDTASCGVVALTCQAFGIVVKVGRER